MLGPAGPLPPTTMERRFQRDLNAVDKVFDFINEFVTSFKVDPSVAYTINVAVEELFVNMVRYNAESPEDISIAFEKEEGKVIIILRDFDSDPFDITEYKAADVQTLIEERKVGGLGLRLVKNMMDEIYYEYRDRQTRIKLIKNLDA